MPSDLVKQSELDAFYQAVAQVEQGKKEQVTGYLRMGFALKQIRDGKLFRAGGFETFEAFADEKAGVGYREACRYIQAVELLPEAILRRVSEMAKPLALRQLTQLQIPHYEFTPDEVERLVGLNDDEFGTELKKMGYDRSKMGGRGPSDLERGRISRDRYRDQSRKVLLLKEKLESATGEREELVRLIKQLQETVAKQNEILSSDDRTRVAHLQIQQQSDIIASYHTAERKTIAQKVDREAAIRLITELRFHILARLRDFRDAVHLPDLETAAWFGVTFDDIRMDVQQVYDFVASDALKEFSETGAPVPLADAAAALGTLTKSIRANLTKLDIEAGRVQVVGKPPKK
jgi:hypothetical protein